MKKIKIILFSIFAYMAASCSLDILPDSSVSNDSYWKTENDAEAAVSGIYTQFRNQLNMWKWMYWFEARSQNIGAGMTSSGIGAYNNNQITPTLDDTSWATLYNVVSQANAVINNIDRINFNNSATRDRLMSEALFFRSWCYFNLVRLWGDVPKITNFMTSLDDPQLYPERSPKSEIYDLILSDIETAVTLNTAKSIQDRTRVSRAAILMLQTEIYMWMHKVEGKGDDYLEKAENAVNEILSFPESVLKLQGTYSSVFENENNSEIIFAIHYDEAEKTDQYGSLLCQSSTLVPAEYRNNPIPVNNSTNRMAFSDMFYEEYRNRTPGDTRVSYISDDIVVNGINYRYTLKYQGEMNGNTRIFTTDTRIYRLAEAYMYKAEILAEKGQYPEACQMLNKVVARAYNDPQHYEGLTGEEFEDTLLDERMIEFAGECKSWFDLIRFGVVFDRVPSLKGRESEKEGNILLLPVHYDTISRNPKIKQTPGYEN